MYGDGGRLGPPASRRELAVSLHHPNKIAGALAKEDKGIAKRSIPVGAPEPEDHLLQVVGPERAESDRSHHSSTTDGIVPAHRIGGDDERYLGTFLDFTGKGP